jgi:hypothetical protein
VLLYEFFQILPHYLAALALDFNTALNKPSVQSVTLANPSKSYVTCVARLEGSSSFQCLCERVTLSPNQPADIQVRFAANTHIPQHATLTLLSDRAASSAPPTKPMEQTGLLTATVPLVPRTSLSLRDSHFLLEGPPHFACPIIVNFHQLSAALLH